MTLLLGIDLGTSYFKVGLFDPQGGLKGLGRVAVDVDTPQPGRVELPVGRFWALLRNGLAAALHQAGATAAEIAGVAYSSQANTFLLVDRHEDPLTPLVLWTDARASELDERWREFTLSGEFGRTTGFNGSTSHAAAAKWLWFQKHEPQLWAQAQGVMTLADYFAFVLTGERVGDAGTAALLGIYDLGAQAWWPRAQEYYGVAGKRFSAPLRPGTVRGKTVAAAEKLLGLPRGISFAVGGLDHHVAALGAGLGSVADASISTGTVLAAVALCDRVTPMPRCYHGPHFEGGAFYRLAFDPRGAGQLEEYRQGFAPESSIEQLIASVEKLPGASYERGAAVRAILEKIAIAHRELLFRLRAGTPVRRVVATGGGARSEVWLQIKADILGLPVVAPASAESACLGAAMLASVAAGVHGALPNAAKTMARPGKTFLPGGIS
jgi:sugar (pentulose or hexulose) kinase